MTENMEATMLRSSGSLRKEDRRKEEKKTPRNPAGTDAVQKRQNRTCKGATGEMRDTGTMSELGGEDITRQKGQTVACLGAGEMTEWLRTLTALPDDGGSILRTLHGKSEPSVTKVPGIKYPLWPRRHCMCMVHKHMCGRHTCMLTIKCGVERFLEATR